MARRTKYKDINEIIDCHLKPRLKSERERLGIPETFIAGIYGIYPEPFVKSSCCEPLEEAGKIEAVRIRIDCEICNLRVAVKHFWHEMRHAKDLYNNRKCSEWNAELYAMKRSLQEPFNLIMWKLNRRQNQ